MKKIIIPTSLVCILMLLLPISGAAQEVDYVEGVYEVDGVDGEVYIYGNNHAPSEPSLNGPSRPGPDQDATYTACSTDLDGDNIWYYFDWSDGTGEWAGPKPSGEEVSATHSWDNWGNYNIRAKARDRHPDDPDGLESGWTNLTIKVPRTTGAASVPDGQQLDTYATESSSATTAYTTSTATSGTASTATSTASTATSDATSTTMNSS